MPEAAVSQENGTFGEGGNAGSALLRRSEEGAIESGSKLELARIAGLSVQLDVRVPVPQFRVADLLGLEPGAVIASLWPSTDDVPLSCGDVTLVWTEFEVVDQILAVRVTRLV